MTIRRVQAHNFMGLEVVDYEFAPAGGVLAGTNGGGKTSTLKAIRAALSGQGISETAIRKGATSAEILIDLDDVTVREVINAKGKGSVTVTRADTGQNQPSPREYLHELLGVAPLDPIELVMAKSPEERRARRATVLRALPCVVSAEQLARWAPDVDLAQALGKGPDGAPATGGHGIDVLARVRDAAFDARTSANRIAKAAKEATERALAATAAARAGLGATPSGVSVAEAEQAAQQAAQALATARARADAAAAAASRSAGTRARAAELRAQAKAKAEGAPAPDQAAFDAAAAAKREALAKREAARQVAAAAEAALRDAEEAERAAINVYAAADGKEADLLDAAEASAAAMREAAELAARADDLLAAAGAGDVGPTDEEIAALAKAHALRLATITQAKAEAVIAEREAAQRAAEAEETAAAEKAKRLDEQVATLTHDAPARLLEAAGGIPGLALEGDSVMLDGVDLDRLSGAEQLRFAVQIARRLNAKSKLLVVDGLEKVDPDLIPGFLAAATDGGWQIICTRVTPGPVHLEPIGGAS